MTNQAGGAAAEGQRGAASPRGFGGAALLPWEPKAARDTLGGSFRPPLGGYYLGCCGVAAERFFEAKSSEYPYIQTLTLICGLQ